MVFALSDRQLHALLKNLLFQNFNKQKLFSHDQIGQIYFPSLLGLFNITYSPGPRLCSTKTGQIYLQSDLAMFDVIMERGH